MFINDDNNCNNRVKQGAGIIAILLSIVMIAFQSSIALGLPVGKAAWGGGGGGSSASSGADDDGDGDGSDYDGEIPIGLRIISGIFVFVYCFIATILAQRAKFKDFGYTERFCSRWTWYVFCFMAFETILNLASPSPLERNTWGPVCFVFAVASFILAREDDYDSQQPSSGQGLSENDHLNV